jgi:AmiR/NasT family two-component response regulator
VPEHEAFEVLRRTSQDKNVKVRELAHQIVVGVVGQEEPGAV